MKRAACLCVLFLLGAFLGLPLGIYLVQHKFIEREKAIGMLSEESIADDFAKKQFVHADQQSAREALLYAIEIHTEMQGTNPLSGWPEKLDLGWCYAELSLLEESAGNVDVARSYMAQAEQNLKEGRLTDSSETRIRGVLQRAVDSSHTMSNAQP